MSSSLLLMMCRGAVGDPVAAVAHDGALLHEVFSYLAAPNPAARGLLGELALVCSIWKDVAASDAFWYVAGYRSVRVVWAFDLAD